MTLPFIKRPDISNGLIHLTRKRFEYKAEAIFPEIEKIISAFEILKEIVTSGIIKASGNEGFIKGSRKAVCFSEIPLSAIHQFASLPGEEKGRYEFYGICLSKRAVFNAGGRPVIYLPDNEGKWIPPEEKWRHVRFEYAEVDHTPEREWRILGDFDLTKVSGLYLLVWSTAEAQEISTLETPICSDSDLI